MPVPVMMHLCRSRGWHTWAVMPGFCVPVAQVCTCRLVSTSCPLCALTLQSLLSSQSPGCSAEVLSWATAQVPAHPLQGSRSHWASLGCPLVVGVSRGPRCRSVHHRYPPCSVLGWVRQLFRKLLKAKNTFHYSHLTGNAIVSSTSRCLSRRHECPRRKDGLSLGPLIPYLD